MGKLPAHLPVTVGQEHFLSLYAPSEGRHGRGVENLDFPLVHPFKSEQTQSLHLGRTARNREKNKSPSHKEQEREEKVQGEEHAPLCFLSPIPSN